MTGFRITRQTAYTIAHNNRRLSALERSKVIPAGVAEWPDLQPVKIATTIDASDGITPEIGDGSLTYWHPVDEELKPIGPIKVYSLSTAPLVADSIHLAIQDSYGNHWVVSASSVTHAVTFQLTAALSAAASTATAVVVSDASGTLPAGTAITVHSLIAYDANVGDYGVALLFGSNYVVIELKHPAGGGGGGGGPLLIHGLLDDRGGSPIDSHYGALASDNTAYVKSGSLTAITPGASFTPFGTCLNPFNWNGAEDDPCIITKIGDDFVLLAVIAQRVPIFFTATGSRTSDSGSYNFNCVVSSYNGPGTAPSVVWDDLKIAFNLKSGGKGKVEWNETLSRWVITSCTKTTLMIRGQVETHFENQPSAFNIINVVGVDGDPPTGTVSVKNVFKTESADDYAEVFAIWNQSASAGDGAWEAVRIACATYVTPVW